MATTYWTWQPLTLNTNQPVTFTVRFTLRSALHKAEVNENTSSCLKECGLDESLLKQAERRNGRSWEGSVCSIWRFAFRLGSEHICESWPDQVIQCGTAARRASARASTSLLLQAKKKKIQTFLPNLLVFFPVSVTLKYQQLLLKMCREATKEVKHRPLLPTTVITG